MPRKPCRSSQSRRRPLRDVWPREGSRLLPSAVPRNYSCTTTYGPNFYIDESAKINTLLDIDVAGEAIFLSPKIGFTVNYLRYHMLLEFRAFASARAALDVHSRVYDTELGHFRDVHPVTSAIGHEATSQSIEAYTIPTCTTMRSLRLTSGRSRTLPAMLRYV